MLPIGFPGGPVFSLPSKILVLKIPQWKDLGTQPKQQSLLSGPSRRSRRGRSGVGLLQNGEVI